MQKIVLLVLFSSFFCLSTKAQFSKEQLPAFSVGVGYFGELLTHPGFVIFGEYAITKSQNQFLTRLNVINYRHKAHTKNWMLTPEIIYRRNTVKLNFYEVAVGIGGLCQRADSKVIVYDDKGFEESSKGWSYFAPSLAMRAGKSLNINNIEITPFGGVRTFCLYPYNSDLLWRFAVDLGIIYKLK